MRTGVKRRGIRYAGRMHDLFTPICQWQRLDLADADVALLRGLLLPEDTLERLTADTPWRQDEIMLFGKRVRQPRLHAWYGDAGARYIYSGLRNEPLPWTPLLSNIKARVEVACGVALWDLAAMNGSKK